jgi:hypothetical protein
VRHRSVVVVVVVAVLQTIKQDKLLYDALFSLFDHGIITLVDNFP